MNSLHTSTSVMGRALDLHLLREMLTDWYKSEVKIYVPHENNKYQENMFVLVGRDEIGMSRVYDLLKALGVNGALCFTSGSGKEAEFCVAFP